MCRKRFRLINLAWITATVAGLVLSVAAPANADPGAWDPTLPAQISAGAPGDPLAVANASLQATAQATHDMIVAGAKARDVALDHLGDGAGVAGRALRLPAAPLVAPLVGIEGDVDCPGERLAGAGCRPRCAWVFWP